MAAIALAGVGKACGATEARRAGWTRRGLGASLAGLAISACAPVRRKELAIWHAYRGRAALAFAKVIASYNSTLPTDAAPLRAVAIPVDAFADKIAAAIAHSEGPDVFIFAHDRLGAWVETGRMVQSIGFWADDVIRAAILPRLVDALTYRGELYGLPINFKSIVLIYDRAVVPEPPKTTGALVALAKQFTDAPRDRFGLAYPYDDFFYHAALQNGFGGGVFDDTRRPILDHAGNLAAGELLLKWKNTDQILPSDPSAGLVQALFNARRAPLAISGPGFLGEVAKDIDVAVAPLPTLDEADGAPIRPWLTIEAAYVAKGSARPEEAFRFAAYLAGPEAGRVLRGEGGQLHAAAAVYGDPAVQADPIAQAFRAQLDTAAQLPNVPDMSLVWSPAEKALKRLVRGEATPAAAWGEAQADVVKSIAALRGRA
jgi:arabinogalactan oligomer/maltooligosaccharide transport system substrate-binding protein